MHGTGRAQDVKAPLTKHEALRHDLLEAISTLPVGHVIPSERQIAEDYHVSRMTARRAVEQLVHEGRLERRQGAGTFIAQPRVSLPLRLRSFTDDLSGPGSVPGAIVQSQVQKPASQEVASVLDVPSGTDVVEIVRVRTMNSSPVSVERAYFEAGRVPDLAAIDLTGRSLYATIVSRYGIYPEGGEERIRAGACNAEDAGFLDIEADVPVLHMTRRTTWHRRPFEYTVSTYRGDRFELVAQLHT